MGQIVDGKRIAESILRDVHRRVLQLKKIGSHATLAVVLVGDHAPSLLYIKKKREAASAVGIDFLLQEFPPDISQASLVQKIRDIQNSQPVSGVIVQLPLPIHLSSSAVLAAIAPEHDVDCMTPACVEALERGTPIFVPPTPGAALAVLGHLGCTIAGKRVAIFGRGPLVGRPLAALLSNAGADVSVIHSKTKNPRDESIRADIVVAGVGKKNLITGDWVKPGAIVIDAGSMVEEGKMYGDVDMESVLPVAGFVTPTPGGVGPITVALLLQNVVIAAERM